MIVIHDDMTVGEVIEKLKTLDVNRKFLVQAIAPDGTKFGCAIIVDTLYGSNAGNGVPYLLAQIRGDNKWLEEVQQ